MVIVTVCVCVCVCVFVCVFDNTAIHLPCTYVEICVETVTYAVCACVCVCVCVCMCRWMDECFLRCTLSSFLLREPRIVSAFM